jgi:hypothetical protein
MRCRQAESLISLVLDDAAGEYQRQQLAEHLSRCEHCRAHEEILRKGRRGLQQSLVDPPENFEWKLALKIQKALRDGARSRDERSSGRAFWTPALVSALVVAAVVVGVGLLSLDDPRSLPSSAEETISSPLRVVGGGQESGRELDLSGAVPAGRLDVDLRGSDFGIRTVGGADPAAGSLFSSDGRVGRRSPMVRSIPVRSFGSAPGGWTTVANPTLRLRFEPGRLNTRPAPRDTAAGRP